MNPVLVDHEWLAATLPDGFETIPHEELEALLGVRSDCIWGVRDTERHIMMNITWKDSNKLLTKLMSEKSFAKQMNERYGKRCIKRSADMGNYRCGGFYERDVTGASARAQGFRFSYTVQGIEQGGEVLIFKRGVRCYALTYYTRLEVAEQNRSVYDVFLSSLEVRRTRPIGFVHRVRFPIQTGPCPVRKHARSVRRPLRTRRTITRWPNHSSNCSARPKHGFPRKHLLAFQAHAETVAHGHACAIPRRGGRTHNEKSPCPPPERLRFSSNRLPLPGQQKLPHMFDGHMGAVLDRLPRGKTDVRGDDGV